MNKITMNVQDLVKAVATDAEMTQKEVRKVIDTIEMVVKAQLAEADENNQVEVKVFPGVSLVAEYVQPHEGRNPSTGEIITVAGKNRVKAKISQTLKAAVNSND